MFVTRRVTKGNTLNIPIVVSNPVWDFVQPQNYIFPELHAEIGLVNNVLDNFYTFIDDQVEALTPEELTSRNSFIVH